MFEQLKELVILQKAVYLDQLWIYLYGQLLHNGQEEKIGLVFVT